MVPFSRLGRWIASAIVLVVCLGCTSGEAPRAQKSGTADAGEGTEYSVVLRPSHVSLFPVPLRTLRRLPRSETIRLEYVSGARRGCGEMALIRIVVADDTVLLKAFAGRRPTMAPHVCATKKGRLTREDVMLPFDLEGRTLRDGYEVQRPRVPFEPPH